MTEKEFKEWESEAFGYGYGTGETPILIILKTFLDSLKDKRLYDHQDLEKIFGAGITWLLINALVKSDIIEYGTSPRFGWLTEKGEGLRDFMEGKSIEQLYEIIMSEDTNA
jgi:hypothetical protein